MAAASQAWRNVADSSPNPGPATAALVLKTLLFSPDLFRVAPSVAEELVASVVAETLRAAASRAPLFAAAAKHAAQFAEASGPLLCVFLCAAKDVLKAQTKAHARFFALAKLFLVHLNAIVSASTAVKLDAESKVACFLVSIICTVFDGNLHQSPDLKQFTNGVGYVLFSLLEKSFDASPLKSRFIHNLLAANELACGHPSLDIDPESVSQDQLAFSAVYLVSLTLTAASVSTEMLIPNNGTHDHNQQQPFTCFLNLLDSLPASSLLTPFDTPWNTLYIHLVASIVVFAGTVDSACWPIFERALFETLVWSENVIVKMLLIEILITLSDDVQPEMITHWLEITFNIINVNSLDASLCSLCGTFARILIDKESEKLLSLMSSSRDHQQPMHQVQRDWMACDTSSKQGIEQGVARWIWTRGGTGKGGQEHAWRNLYLDMAMSLWNAFLEMLDTDGSSPHQGIIVLQAFSFPIRFMNASISQFANSSNNDSDAAATITPIADVVVFLIDGMTDAFEMVMDWTDGESAGGGNGSTNGVIAHMYRTVSELLELAASLQKWYSPDQKAQMVDTLESWTVHQAGGMKKCGAYLPKQQTLDLIFALKK
ncbi:UNVERIFIED_CONTAM: hypothetical protein HDU68_008365 [Siphonaria sp. JEL0065]|nr:hypothetical protein HDU68_008365 [Siphonaria sp. JEL0065]